MKNNLREKIIEILGKLFSEDKTEEEIADQIIALIKSELPEEKVIPIVEPRELGFLADGISEFGWNSYRHELLKRLGL